MPKNDTIVAQATPRGFGGVAIVRISGSLALAIAKRITQRDLIPRYATLCNFLDMQQTLIDTGIALYFPAPHSFTGEDVVELQGHGGPVVVDILIKTILQMGARLALPGEFSERAFLNGKIDLAQAEAIADIIHASSENAVRAAQRTLQGEFSQSIQAINQQLIKLRLYLEALIDFAEEEIDFLQDQQLQAISHVVIDQIANLEVQATQGSMLREGIAVVLTGKPNVGKSSLLNRLSGQEIAIVTDIPGTTRDVLRHEIIIDGLPIHIIDTAGLHATHNIIEQEGIKRAHAELLQADLVLHMTEHPDDDAALLPATYNGAYLRVQNKMDLWQESHAADSCSQQAVVNISAKTGAGIDILRTKIKSLVGFNETSCGLFYARRRHLQAIALAKQHVHAGIGLIKQTSIELAAEEMRLAHQALATITGDFTADDLLGHIFAQFCIGK